MILDTDHPKVREVFERIVSPCKTKKEKAIACYNYVRDHINFGYNSSDDIKASEVLRDGYGQCNTKATVLMAFMKMLNIPTRIHGFKINKKLQKGVFSGVIYFLAPERILHSWIEVNIEGQWHNLEGFILDDEYLKSLRTYFSKETSLCGFGVATSDWEAPQVDWRGNNCTYIQKEGIVEDLGIYESPDEFYSEHGTNLRGFKRYLYRFLVRHIANYRVSKIRNRKMKELNLS